MTRYRWIRYFAYTVELLVVFIAQETPGLVPTVFGERPLLLLPAVLSVALFENERVSMGFGLFGGLLIDFGVGTILGFHALLLAVVCYFLALFAANLIQTNFLTAMIVSAVICAFVVLLQWIFYFLLFGYADPGYALLVHYFPRFCYTAAAMALFYYFNRALALHLRSEAE